MSVFIYLIPVRGIEKYRLKKQKRDHATQSYKPFFLPFTYKRSFVLYTLLIIIVKNKTGVYRDIITFEN